MSSKEKLLESAQKFIAKGQIAKAIGDYQKLVDAFPKDLRFRQKLAELLTRERRHEDAQPHYDAVAKNFTETGFYLKAIAIYKQMQKVEPNRADLYLHLAELNEKQGLVGNALTEYRSLIALFEKNKQLRETLPVLQKMVALDKENLGVRGKLIESLLACHDDEAALEQFRTLVAFLEDKGEAGKILKLYEKFQNLCAGSARDQLPLVRALVTGEQANKALALLKELLKSDPDDAEVLGQLIDCHVTLGNHEDARLTCQHLLKTYPDNLLFRERHVRLCLAAGDRNRAQASLDESRDQFHQAGQTALFNELLAEVQGVSSDQLQAYEPTTAAEVVLEQSAAAPVAEPVEPIAAADFAVKAEAADKPPLPVTAKTPPAAGGGFELELDLDLELPTGAPVSTIPPVTPPAAAPVPEPAAVLEDAAVLAPPEEIPTSAELPQEMELELDLGDFEMEAVVAPELPPTPAIAEAQAGEELELEIGFEDTAIPAADGGLPVAGGRLAFEQEEAGLEFELELPPGLEFEPPPIAGLEPDIKAEAEEVFEFEGSVELELPAELPEVLPEELHLPEAGDVEPVMEPPEFEIEPEGLGVSEPDTLPAEAAGAELLPEEEVLPEERSLPAIGVGLPAPAGISDESEISETSVELQDLDELEEVIEELDEIEAFEELEELAEIEELEEVEDQLPPPFEPTPIETVPAASSSQLLEGLEDVDFYLRSGLLDDAERVTRGLLNDFIDYPELLARLAEIESLRQAPAAVEETATEPGGFADINEDELLGGVEFADAEAPTVDEFSLEAPVASAEAEEEDLQSHFDLGIAYKEMGLLDDAVAEFDRAARDPARRLDCLTLKGQCQLEMGQAEAAEATYRQALEIPLLNEEGRLVLCYELGLLYEILGRKQEALDNYQVVANIDLFFRDVTDKLRVLRQELGIDDQAIEAVSESGAGRDRISFV